MRFSSLSLRLSTSTHLCSKVCAPKINMAVTDSMPDSKSVQPALFRAKAPPDSKSVQPGSKDATSIDATNGTWYQKAPLTNSVTTKEKFDKTKFEKNFKIPKAEEIRDSLFHYQCNCKLWKLNSKS